MSKYLSHPYNLEEDNENSVVFERSENDKDKEVIVLSSAEEKVKLRSSGTKQTYVVLRKQPATLTSVYYVVYAYVRLVNSTIPELKKNEVNDLSCFF
jgi:phage terminase large subunit